MKPIRIAAAVVVAASLIVANAAVADPPPGPDAPLNVLHKVAIGTIFIAPQTLQRDGDQASVWTVFLIRSDAPNMPADFAGGWDLQRFTCSARIGESDTADMLNRSLQINHIGGQPRPQKPINPNSPKELAYRFACLGDASVIGAPVANLRAAYNLVEQ